MQLIVVKNRYGDSVTLSGKVLVVISMVILLMFASIFMFAFKYQSQQQHIMDYQSLITTNKQLENQVARYQNDIVATSNNYNRHVNAFGVKLAQLQSEVIRINALGERLVSVSGISAEEFNFASLPSTGGPESEKIGASVETFTCHPDAVLGQIASLDQSISSQSEQINVLSRFIEGQENVAQSYISGRPIVDSQGWLSSRYGMRKDPFENKLAMHKGIDYAAREGTDIIATGAGVITWAGRRSGYGNLVEINHGNGLITRYGHAKEVLVKTGDIVEKGSVVALVGSTGRSTGPHIHYEVLVNGVQVNPEKYIIRDAM